MATVRRAAEDDATGVVELSRVHNGEHAAVELKSVLRAGHISPSDFAVAVVGDRVVSAVSLLPMELRLGDGTVPRVPLLDPPSRRSFAVFLLA
jgi:hypothetical protein